MNRRFFLAASTATVVMPLPVLAAERVFYIPGLAETALEAGKVVFLALHQTVFFILNASTAGFGALFDASPFDMLPDELLLWVMVTAPLALFGAGPLSVDDALRRWKDRRG